MNSVTYFNVAGMTPAAPLVLHISLYLYRIWQQLKTYGAVTTRPPEALTSFTYHQPLLTLI